MPVAAWPFESDQRSEQLHLWWSRACLAAWILSRLQKSTWWVTKACAEGEIQMPNIARRTGASATLRETVTKQSNDKESDKREGTAGTNTAGGIRGWRIRRVVCGIPWLCRMKGSPGRRRVYVQWGAAVAKVLTAGETGLWHFTQGWASFSRPWQVSVVERRGATLLWKRSAWEESRARTERWQISGVEQEKDSWNVNKWAVRGLWLGDEWEEKVGRLAAACGRGLLSRLPDSSTRKRWQLRASNCTWWGSHLLERIRRRNYTY